MAVPGSVCCTVALIKARTTSGRRRPPQVLGVCGLKAPGLQLPSLRAGVPSALWVGGGCRSSTAQLAVWNQDGVSAQQP